MPIAKPKHWNDDLAEEEYVVPQPICAPTQEVWDRMTEAERAAVIESLPIVVEDDFMSEGDCHAEVVTNAAHMLDWHFRHGGGRGRTLYVGKSVQVYYPGAASFAPDVFVVLDVPDGPRDSWVVAAEGKGLDFALEVHWKGSKKKDFADNVVMFAARGIPEYFIFDRARLQILGYRLRPGGGNYHPILPQGGRYYSQVLGLWISREGEFFRFSDGDSALPTARELVVRLTNAMAEAEASAAAESARATAEAEARLALEARVAELVAQLAALNPPNQA